MKKIFLAIIMVLSMLFVTSCGGDKDKLDPNNDVHKNEKVAITDIDWKVDMGIKYGERYLMFNFANNSEYTIYELSIELSAKKSFKGDKLEGFYSYFQEEYEQDEEDMEYIKEYGKLRIECTHYELLDDPVEPGATSESQQITYYGMYYIFNKDYYDMFEPNIATIKYADEGKLYTVYYDYKENTYTHDSYVETLD